MQNILNFVIKVLCSGQFIKSIYYIFFYYISMNMYCDESMYFLTILVLAEKNIPY